MATVLVLTAAACPCSESAAPQFDLPEPAWTPVYEGVAMAQFTLEAPVLMALVALRVDLEAEGVSFFVTPSNGDAAGETDSRTPSTFLTECGCQAALNASPFSPVTSVEGQPQDVLGLSVSNGDAYSAPHGDWGALAIDADNHARIFRQSEPVGEAHNAVGGFDLIVEQGVVIAPQDVRHPRTGAGVSEDGRHLYFVVIDGRQLNHSLGATQAELGACLLQLGAYVGVNLDGGGSTTLVFDDAEGGARVINRPIHAGIPGRERPSANHIGIYARRLPEAPGQPVSGTAN